MGVRGMRVSRWRRKAGEERNAKTKYTYGGYCLFFWLSQVAAKRVLCWLDQQMVALLGVGDSDRDGSDWLTDVK